MKSFCACLCAAAMLALSAAAWGEDGDVIGLKRHSAGGVDNGMIAVEGGGYRTAIYHFGDLPAAFKVGFGVQVDNVGGTATHPIAYQLGDAIIATSYHAADDVVLDLTGSAIENGPITIGVADAVSSPSGFMGLTKDLRIVTAEVTFAPTAPVVQIVPSAKDVDAPIFIDFTADYTGPAGTPIREEILLNGLRVYLLDAEGRPTTEIPRGTTPIRIIGSDDENSVFATFNAPMNDLFITGGAASAGAVGGTARLALVKGTGGALSLHSGVTVVGTKGAAAPDASDVLATVEIRVCDHLVTPSSVTIDLPRYYGSEPEFTIGMRTDDLDCVREGSTVLITSRDLSQIPGGLRYASRGGVELLGGEDELTVKIGRSFIYERARDLIAKAGGAAIDETITLQAVDAEGKFGEIAVRFTKAAGAVGLPASVETTAPAAPSGVAVDKRIDLTIMTNCGTSADIVPGRGFSDGDFAVDAGLTTLTAGALDRAARAAGLSDGTLLTSLPIVSQDVKAAGNFAIFTFRVPGIDLVNGDSIPASEVDVCKIMSAGSCTNISGRYVPSYAALLEHPTDGGCTFVGLDDLSPVDRIVSTETYRLIIAIQDGGEFDLNSGDRIVADPLAVAKTTPKGHGGGGSCATGAGLFALAALAALAARRQGM